MRLGDHSINILKSRRFIIVLLLMLSFVLTTGTFAFWATSVEGNQASSTGTLEIGSGQSVTTVFELTNELNSGGLLVPSNQIDNSGFGSVDQIDITHHIAWNENNTLSQLEGTITEGLVGVQHKVTIYQNDVELTYEDNELVYSLIKVDYNENNPTKLTLNEDSKKFVYHITMDEPDNQEAYSLIADSNVVVEFYYIIGSNDITTTDIDNTELVIVETDEIYFSISSSSSDKIIDYDIEGGLDVVIPKKINDVEIKILGDNLFLREGINSVIIQEGITYIGTNTFHSNNLETVSIPSTVETISYNAFNYNDLTSVKFEEGLLEIRAGAFGNNKLTTVHLPSTVTEVGAGAFGYGENFITEIVIGDNVTIGSSSSFGWYGSSFISMYKANPEAGTYLYIDGTWVLS